MVDCAHAQIARMIALRPRFCKIPYSGYFSRGNIFVKVVILAISWKKFRGRDYLLPILGARTRCFSWVNISWFASRPRKPRKYYPPKNTRYTVRERCGSLQNAGMWAVVRQPQTRRKIACNDQTAHYRFMVVAGALAGKKAVNFMIKVAKN